MKSKATIKPGAAAALLLTAAHAAEVLGVSERKFHDLRKEPWMPRPVVLGPRMTRWVRADIEGVAPNMSRQAATAAPPPQLMKKRGRPPKLDRRQEKLNAVLNSRAASDCANSPWARRLESQSDLEEFATAMADVLHAALKRAVMEYLQ